MSMSMRTGGWLRLQGQRQVEREEGCVGGWMGVIRAEMAKSHGTKIYCKSR